MIARRVVLVTGAGGFIGRWSVAPLIALGFDVHAVVSRRSSAAIPIEVAGATLHYADLLEESQIDALVTRTAPTHLLHFAWIATPGVYWQSAENFRWLAMSQHLLRRFRAAGGTRAVLAGTCAEYDWSTAGICHEMTTALADRASANITAYAAAKLAMQEYLATFAAQERLSSAWGRIFFQYGPHEHPDRLVPSVIRSLLAGREALCTHGRQVRSFLHVADLGAAFAHLLDSHVEGPVNMGSPDRIELAGLIGMIGQKLGASELVWLGARPAAVGEPALLVPDTERLRVETAWQPRFTLSDGLDDTIAWWRAQA